MQQPETTPCPAPGKARRLVWKIGQTACAAVIVAVLVQNVSNGLQRRQEPAGFVQGLAQGALMPMSFPNLLLGKDVALYAEANTGRGYKLGYTLGVNVCGLIFFGMLFRARKGKR